VDQSQQWFLEENQQQPKPDNTGGIPAPEVNWRPGHQNKFNLLPVGRLEGSDFQK